MILNTLEVRFVAPSAQDSTVSATATPVIANGIDVDDQGNIWAAGGNRLLIYVGDY